MRAILFSLTAAAALATGANGATAQTYAQPEHCANDWRVLSGRYDTISADPSDGKSVEFHRYVSAGSVYRALAGMIAGRAPEELGKSDAELRSIATDLLTADRLLICNGAPVLVNTAEPDFRAYFDAFDKDYSFNDRYNLELMYGAYL